MTGCCDPKDVESVFTRRFARHAAKRYVKRGLNPTATRIVDFVASQSVEGASVLEIGGGVGELHLELLRRGASSVTNLEIATTYEAEAARLLAEAGVAGQVSRRFVDIATAPDEVEPADVVVLHRVVCCYPDYRGLLTTAASHARRVLVYSHPADNQVNRLAFGTLNLLQRMRRNGFRAFVHPPDAMIAVAEDAELTVAYRHHSWDWDVVGMVREAG